MTADEAKQALKEGQIWYDIKNNKLLRIIEDTEDILYVDYGNLYLHEHCSIWPSDFIYIGDL